MKLSFRYFLGIIFLFIQCASNPVSETLESWQIERDNKNYWYGVSIISKKPNIDNIQEVARNQAIAEIASQIKININQDFKRIVEEKNYNINDYSIQIIDSRVNMNIEDVEILDFRDSKDSYMLIARLSKNKYYDNIKRKRDNATALALEYVSKIKSPTLESFENLVNAENLILPYLDYPIYIEYESKTENLYSLIHSIRDDLISRIVVLSEKNNISLKELTGDNQAIIVQTMDRQTNLALPNIPLVSIFNGDVSKCSTNSKGECEFFINKPSFTKEIKQSLKINIDRESLYKNTEEFNYLDCQVILNLEPINIYIEVSEENLGRKNLHPYIEPIVKEYFITNFNSNFITDKEKSDINIKVSVSTRTNTNKSNEFGVYQVFADATIDVIINNQAESILKMAINDIQGADFTSFDEAGHKALKKIRNKIFDETLPDLVSILNKN